MSNPLECTQVATGRSADSASAKAAHHAARIHNRRRITITWQCEWAGWVVKPAPYWTEDGSVEPRTIKPLGRKSYGHIGHLPGSRIGPGDHMVHEGQGKIATVKTRDRHDVIIVQEKLDGSNVGVARLLDGSMVALGRAGYPAQSSPYEQHQLFAAWVRRNESRFDFLKPGERVCGEWLAQAHGTIYQLTHEPFVAFDLMREDQRANFAEFTSRVGAARLVMPHVLSVGAPVTIEAAMAALGDKGFHGATDKVEGAVWRIERKGEVDFLCKYVRPDKVDGCYLPELSGKPPVWNWRPDW